MLAAEFQVLQDRKAAISSPKIIDVLATQGLWISPGGKNPSATLFAAISWRIKSLGMASPIRKTEREKFGAMTNDSQNGQRRRGLDAGTRPD